MPNVRTSKKAGRPPLEDALLDEPDKYLSTIHLQAMSPTARRRFHTELAAGKWQLAIGFDAYERVE